jgi:acyl carrier protein
MQTTPQDDPKSEILGRFSAMLKVPQVSVDCDVHVLELGVDSIMLIEAQQWLQSHFGCRIEVPQFFEELNTINKIASFIQAERANSGEKTESTEPLPRSDQRRRSRSPASDAPDGERRDFNLLRAQLMLVADVVEAQNRLLKNGRA